MPRSSSLTSIATYLLYRVGSAASGLANGWISISTNRYRGITGTFSNTSNGQIITVGADSNTSTTLTNTARIINRHKSNGNIYWAVNYPANTYIFANHISVERYETASKDVPDSSQNVYIGVSHSSSSSALNTRVNVIRLTPTGTIGFQRQITDVSGEFAFSDLKSDYLGVTFTEFQYILRLNTAGSTVYQKQYVVPSGHDFPTIRACEAFDNVSWFTADSRQYGNTFYSQVISLTSTGTISWGRQLGIGIGRFFISEGMCVDSDKNVYLVGRETSTGTTQGFVAKLTNTGSLDWAQRFSNTTITTITYSKKDDAVYFTGRDSRNSTVAVISKLYSNGVVDYTKTIHAGDGQEPNIFPDREGYIYLANKDFVTKFKADGSDTGVYALANTITYANASSSNVTVTDILSSMTSASSGVTLTNSSLGITTPATSLTTIQFSDTITNL